MFTVLLVTLVGACVAYPVLTRPCRSRMHPIATGVGRIATPGSSWSGKASGHVFHRGISEGLTSWEPYAWLLVAAFGFLLAQSGIHAGPLDASMPLLVVAGPLSSALIGVGVS